MDEWATNSVASRHAHAVRCPVATRRFYERRIHKFSHETVKFESANRNNMGEAALILGSNLPVSQASPARSISRRASSNNYRSRDP
eukprot:scaffold311898_cov35-Tisochrysis_lutea.AAC.2